jgi:catechol 2,3-dioxygenase-like lactoylglutathione lyase family enzyme
MKKANTAGKVALDHLNLTVRDFKESVDWYGRIFGFEMVENGFLEGAPWGILRSQDSMLCIYEDKDRVMLLKNGEDDRFHRVFHFGLRIQNREEWENILERDKLPVFYGGPVRYPHSTSWYIEDPSGYTIEVALWDMNQVKF